MLVICVMNDIFLHLGVPFSIQFLACSTFVGSVFAIAAFVDHYSIFLRQQYTEGLRKHNEERSFQLKAGVLLSPKWSLDLGFVRTLALHQVLPHT